MNQNLFCHADLLEWFRRSFTTPSYQYFCFFIQFLMGTGNEGKRIDIIGVIDGTPIEKQGTKFFGVGWHHKPYNSKKIIVDVATKIVKIRSWDKPILMVLTISPVKIIEFY